MSDLAIALCRVSTPEQIQNNSLNRQREAVERCAKEKDLKIIKWWSGSISSKTGTNLKRKDLNEMLTFCSKNKLIKFLIVDEYDRFMRSGDEGPFFEVTFKTLGVKVWFASEDETFNSDTALGKFLRASSAFRAEGSNEERINKSISGGRKAIQEGRLPSSPKAGYMKGEIAGVHIIDPVTGIHLQRALKMIASHLKTPTEALQELIKTDFGKRYSNYKMDKFRITACEPYYAGIIELKGKFNLRNENGLHEPLITREEHENILRVFDKNPKNQQGHRPDKNTKYPLSNELTCASCENNEEKYPRFTSVPLNNGKTNHGKARKKVSYYAKYRCRGCNILLDRDETHNSFSELLDQIIMKDSDLNKLKNALLSTFNNKHHETKAEIARLEFMNKNIKERISQKVEAVTDPSNAYIKDEIQELIHKLKIELIDNETRISQLSEQHESDLGEFLDFALDFLDNKGKRFFELSGEDMKRCKQLIFTGKIYVGANKNIYTHNLSPIFRGIETKIDTEVSVESHVVRVKRL